MRRKSHGESARHLLLKRAAIAWAKARQYQAVGEEVRIPHSHYRADVAACRIDRGQPVVSALFECKQARSDFLKDSRAVQATVARLAELEARKQDLDRLLGLHYPTLRASDELFQEFVVPVRAEEIGHEGYAAVQKEITLLQSRLYGRTKFSRLLRYANVSLHYLVVQPGILEPAEVPAGWGLLMLDPDSPGPDDGLPSLQEITQPTFCDTVPGRHVELLSCIARAGTRLLERKHELPPGLGFGLRAPPPPASKDIQTP